MKNISFTGHRDISDIPAAKKRLRSVLEPLIMAGADEFFTGGAIGFDTLAAEAVIELREKYPDICLNLILPCEREYQTFKWSEKQKDDYDYIRRNADSAELIGIKHTKYCMTERNRRLVENADMLICWYDKNNDRSGTGQTVRMAEGKDIKILNLFLSEENIITIK